MRDPEARLSDMLAAADRLGERGLIDADRLAADYDLQVWVLHHLQLIGESVAGLPREFTVAHPAVDWKGLKGLRDVLVHRYFELDWQAISRALNENLPATRIQIETILRDRREGNV